MNYLYLNDYHDMKENRENEVWHEAFLNSA